MKNVIISGTALASSGGLSILKQFIQFASTQSDVHFVFFVPEAISFNPHSNITYIKVARKNWLQRILWDTIFLQREIKKLKCAVDCVISLQNTSVNVSAKQLVYVHQSIPFSDLKTPFTKSGIKIWLYKKFYSFFIFLFSDKDTSYFVQTEWMRNAIIKKKNVNPRQVHVVKPELVMDGLNITGHRKEGDVMDILYPATPLFYKQHALFIDIVRTLKNKYGLDKINVHFTFTADMDPNLIERIKENHLVDNFVFHGVLSQKDLYALYNKVDLIVFPSLLETVGLPLLEAAYLGKPILVSDLPYAHEVLKDYDGAYFVNPDKGDEWAEVISKYNSGDIPSEYNSLNYDASAGWMVFRNFF
ncbi:glycosyltransferase [Leclercia sp. J807]|uniref:glycosyltransferase n=1 Tax=Leclercia sp. J807 TaxID=2681307 RepID=UPI0012E17189|nr:glycosyltransferase [Leclercia sp. J807]QGU11515.1 glycosyltransferase [Leclercia sp. J807]